MPNLDLQTVILMDNESRTVKSSSATDGDRAFRLILEFDQAVANSGTATLIFHFYLGNSEWHHRTFVDEGVVEYQGLINVGEISEPEVEEDILPGIWGLH